MPNVGKLTPTDLRSASERSCTALQDLGPEIQWVETFVTDDRLYCVFVAPSEEMIREHAREGGFPVHRISQVRSILRPLTVDIRARRLH